MTRPLLAAAGGLALAASLFGQPAVTRIGNNYGWLLPGSPGYGIAQGSIFAVKGTHLGPSDYQITETPSIRHGGSTINVTVNGTTVQALNYYSGPQLAAVLPSNTPLGSGT